MRATVLFWGIGMMVVAGAGCESSVSTRTCTPGAMQACACVDGAKGAQTCRQDGVGFAPCVCAGSGTSGGIGAGGSMGCIPGEQVACTCDDGSSGAQVCNGSETFDPCVCTSSSTTGMGGTGGTTGQGGSGACLNDLSNVGNGDFRIALKLQTTQSGTVAVVNQRTPACVHEVFWDLRVLDGHLYMETDDTVNYMALTSLVAVNDGALHNVVVKRVSSIATIEVDGNNAGSDPSAATLGSLPTLRIGNDPCASDLVGTVNDVCLTRP